MLQGKLSIQHPGLNLRSEFRKAFGQGGDTQVAFLDRSDKGLGAALQDFSEFNLSARQSLVDAYDRYRAEQAAEPPAQPQSGPMLAAPPASFQRLREFQAAQGQHLETVARAHSEQAQVIAQQVALTASSWVGPVLMTSCRDLGKGILALGFSRQTSREMIRSSNQPLASITGNQIGSSDRGRENLRSAAQDPTLPVYCEPTTSHTVLIDSQTGFFALKPEAKATP